MPPGVVAPPWRIAGLPGQKMPLTQFGIVAGDSRPVLRVAADASYGNLVYETLVRPGSGDLLRWSWSLDADPAIPRY